MGGSIDVAFERIVAGVLQMQEEDKESQGKIQGTFSGDCASGGGAGVGNNDQLARGSIEGVGEWQAHIPLAHKKIFTLHWMDSAGL